MKEYTACVDTRQYCAEYNRVIDHQPMQLARLFIQLQVLRETPVGAAFFGSVAKAATVKNILQQCYGDPATVTDELVDVILKPGLTDGATKVFLDFISYSGGPLPEELLPKMTVPVLIGKCSKLI
jgi:hypothetical protein